MLLKTGEPRIKPGTVGSEGYHNPQEFMEMLERNAQDVDAETSIAFAKEVAKANPKLAEPGIPETLVNPPVTAEILGMLRRLGVAAEDMVKSGAFIKTQKPNQYLLDSTVVMGLTTQLFETSGIYANNLLDSKKLEEIEALVKIPCPRTGEEKVFFNLVKIAAQAEAEKTPSVSVAIG